MEHTGAVRLGTESHSAALVHGGNTEANATGVSWSAVLAGGVVVAALSLILLALGTGLGFASISVWPGSGVSAGKAGAAAVVWFIVIEIISASMGGYLAGRLRTKWTGIHTDEVYFRDTAHGFLAWAVALVIISAFLTSSVTSLLGSSTSGRSEHEATSPNAYFVDSLFRGAKAQDGVTAGSNEAVTIFAYAIQRGALSGEDRAFLDQRIMAVTGASQGDADARVSEAFSGAQNAAETARKTLAHSLLWMFIGLLIGAFCGSFAGTIGGRQRDHVVAV